MKNGSRKSTKNSAKGDKGKGNEINAINDNVIAASQPMNVILLKNEVDLEWNWESKQLINWIKYQI